MGIEATLFTPYLVQPLVLGRVLLLLDTEQVQAHGDGEEDGGEEEQDLLLGFEGYSKESVRPVQTSESVADSTAEACTHREGVQVTL